MKPILNIADAETNGRLVHGDRFEARLAELTAQLGTRAITARRACTICPVTVLGVMFQLDPQNCRQAACRRRTS
ncbi:MAG: hypothetical protein ACT4QA_00355 [Panacagrimonas sp.]